MLSGIVQLHMEDLCRKVNKFDNTVWVLETHIKAGAAWNKALHGDVLHS